MGLRKRIAYLSVLFLMMVSSCFAQTGTRKDDVALQNVGGFFSPIPNASIRVCQNGAVGLPCTPLANIWGDSFETIPLANPFTADVNGNYFFYATAGNYVIQVTSSTGGTYTQNDVTLPNLPSNVTTTFNYSALSFSSTPNFSFLPNTFFKMVLTGNVISSTISGSPSPGAFTAVSLCQDSVGGHTFVFPTNFVLPVGFIFQTGSGNCNNIEFLYDGVNWQGVGGGGSGGAPPTGNVNILQKNGGGGLFAPTAESDDGTNFIVGTNSRFLGPNPYTDVTSYGVRSVNVNVAPQIPGVLASVTGTNVVLSSASTFQNGDGVTIYGAGAACGLSSTTGVTVTPVLAAGPTGTGLVVPAPAGSTSYSYAVLPVDFFGCYPAASAIASTSTGAASLGAHNFTITGFTQSGNVVTATTSSTAALATGARIYISTSTTPDANFFGGWYVITVTGGTTFTYVTGNQVALGAPSVSQGGGTGFYWVGNEVSWSATAGAYRYFGYGRISGSLSPVFTSPVNNPGGGFTITSWEDWGSTMMAGQLFPFWLPSTPPVASFPRPLTTTIVSGAGTVNLVVANPATTPATNQTILFDDGPGLLAAATAVGSDGLVYFPPGGYVVNSFTNIPFGPSFALAGANLYLNETLFGQGLRFYGLNGPQAFDASSFGWVTGGTIESHRANPGVIDGQGFNYQEGIRYLIDGNGGTGLFVDNGGSQGHFKNLNFDDQSPTDYMSTPLQMRGGFWYDLDHIALNSGPGQAGSGFIGSTSTPAAILNVGDITFNNMSVQDRGIYYIGSSAGIQVQVTGINHVQGGITPFLTFAPHIGGGCVGGNVLLTQVEMDTTQMNIFENLDPCADINVVFNGITFGAGIGYGNMTGYPVASVTGTASGQNSGSIVGAYFSNNAVAVNGAGEFIYPIQNNVASTIALSSGGSVPTNAGNIFYYVTVEDVNGNESSVGPASNQVTPTPGTQTITVTPPAAPVGAVGWKPYRCSVLTGGCALANIPVGCSGTAFLPFGANYVDTFAFGCGQSIPTSNRAGSSTLGSGGIGTFALNILGGGFKDVISGTFTANRAQALQDVNDTFVYRNSPDTLTLKILTSPVLNGTISGTGVQGTDTKVLSAGTVSGTGASLCTDALGGATTSGCPASASFYQTVKNNGTSQTQEPAINFIPGTNITITCTDSAGVSTNCTITSSATAATAFSALTPATNNTSGNFIATGNVWDYSGATTVMPVGAGLAPTANGRPGYDSTANKWVFGQNGSTVSFGLSSAACSANQWVSTPATGTATAACTQPAFSNLFGSATSGQLPATIVYNNQANTWSTGAQNMSAAVSFTLPTSALYAPTTSGQEGYDSSNQKWVFGQNGATVSFGLSSSACAANQFVNTPATATTQAACAQPSFTNLAGVASAAQLPTPTASTLGGIESYTAVAHQWINAISTAGVPSSVAIGTNDISPNLYAAGGGTAQAQTVTLSPAATSLVAGLQAYWLPLNANTGAAPTLAVNGLAAKSITKFGNSTPLTAGDLTTNAIAFAIYDGTEWQLQNPQTSTGGGSSITLQTNGTNNITQTSLNFLTSTTNAIGGTITPSNPTGGQEIFELTGRIAPIGGGTGLSSPTAHSLLVAEGSGNMNLVTSPSTNGACVVFFNVTAGAAVDPTCGLQGVPVNAQAGNYSLLYSDRLNYIKESGTSTATLTLPQITGATASNFQFVTQNLNSGNETLTANAADKIDGSATGGSATLLPTFAAFVYSDSSSVPGNWWTLKVPTFASFGSTCANIESWSTTTGFTCVNASGAMFANFSAHQFLGNNTSSSAAPAPSLIGTSDITPNWYAAATGTAQAQVVALTPAVTALTIGTQVNFLPVAANTGSAPTLAVNGLTAKTITKFGSSTALVANDLTTNAIATVIYDGTEWQLENPQTATGGGGGGTPCTGTANALQYNNSGAFGCVVPFTFASNTITAASAGILDLSGATGASAFKVPVQAGATAASDGVVDYDSTAKLTHIRTNAADSIAAATTSTTTTMTQALFATATAGIYNPRAIATGDLPAIPWNSNVNPTGNLSLTMGANTSIFSTTTAEAQMFAWKNTTAATSSTSQGSPIPAICGRAWHGSADVEDCLTIGELPGNGNDAAIVATLGHSGTSAGTFTVNAANFNATTSISTGTAPACTGSGTFLCMAESAAFTNVSATAGVYADSSAHEFFAKTNGASAAGMLIRAQPAPINSTGNTGAISTATLCAASAGACNVAGQYHISWTFIETGTACSVPGTGGVTFLLTWTDSNGTTHSAVSLGMDDASAINAVSQTFHFQTSLAAAWGSGDFNISTNGSVIQYATGYTACGTGTGTYQLQAVVTRAGQ